MIPSDTRPGELNRLEAQRIAEETARLLRIAGNEQEYRQFVLITLTRVETKLEAMEKAFGEHVTEDDERFKSNNQRLTVNESWINKALGMILLLVFLSGVIMWAVDKMKGN